MKIVISPFCYKNSASSCKIPLEEIIPEILQNLDNAEPGYREGVILVKLKTENFVGQLRTLQEGDKFSCQFVPRIDGETPRKEIRTHGNPDPLVAVQAVLYANHVLQEGNEASDTTADYEVITILTKISEDEQPMPPETLMANHFVDSGGTSTNMTDEKFTEALKKSYFFWKDKAIVDPSASLKK